MKKVNILIVAALLLGAASCSTLPDEVAPQADTRIVSPQKILISNIWTIDLFWNAGQDQTDDYTNFVLAFADNHEAKAYNGKEHIRGQWKYAQRDGQHILTLRFEERSSFRALNREWVWNDPETIGNGIAEFEVWNRTREDSYLLHLRTRR